MDTALVPQATSDAQCINLWLMNRPANTRRAYEREIARFLSHVAKPLPAITLQDVYDFIDSRKHLSVATIRRSGNAVRSLFRYACLIGYLRFNPALPVALPKAHQRLADRILEPADVHAMIRAEPNTRWHLLLRLAYATGGRVSELCALRWQDVRPRGEDRGQVTVLGKGNKLRAIVVTGAMWQELWGRRGLPNGYVFATRTGGPLSPVYARLVFRRAARRVGIEADVSPHFFRHCHASHAIEHGAPLHLVAATLGHSSVATTGAYLHARPDKSSGDYLDI